MENKDYTRFSCCAFWQQCDLGRGTCVFDTTEPNKKHFCGAYLNRDYREELQQVGDVQNITVIEQEAPVHVEPATPIKGDEDLFLVFDGTPLTSPEKPANKPGFIEATGQFTLF